MKMRLVCSLVLVSAGMVLIPASVALAQVGGKLNFRPGIGIKLTYDDNIYSGSGANTANEREQSDVITSVQPSLHLVYNITGRGIIDLGYDGTKAFYRDQNNNDWTANKFSFLLNYKSPKGIITDVDYVVNETDDPFGSADEYALGVRKGRVNHRLNSRLGYDFGSGFRALGYYNYGMQDYYLAVDAAQDFTSNEFGAGVEKRVAPKTWGFVRYHYGIKDYDSVNKAFNTDANSNWSRANFGVIWDATAKLNGEVNFGYKWVNYKHYKDQALIVASTAVNYLVNKNTEATINISREIREAIGNFSGATDQAYKATGIRALLTHNLNTKITGNVGASYALLDYYSPSARDDTNITFDIGLAYQVRTWLEANAGYSYSSKDSSVNTNDYNKNQVSIILKSYFYGF